MGADRDQVRQRQPLPEVRALIGEFPCGARRFDCRGAGGVLCYESQFPRVARPRRKGWPSSYAADAKTCGYFTLHQFADLEHARIWHELLAAEVGGVS